MAAQLGRLAGSLFMCLGIGMALWSATPSRGQDPAGQPAAPAQGAPAAAPPQREVVHPAHVRPQAYYRQQRRSIVQHYPYPYPGYYYNDESAGFRNPGGVGRHAEYYPPGDQFQIPDRDPVRVAQFGVGGYPSRAEQLQAQQVGISRYNSIQRSIDNYAMPHWGYGFGVGGFGGFW
jgi:hypothetical protein